MPIKQLNENEKDIVFQCLVAALNGPFFPEWEFTTLFGIDRKTLSNIVESWPQVDDSKEDVALAINNSMGNLIGYPHGKKKEWGKYISVPPDKVSCILRRWKE